MKNYNETTETLFEMLKEAQVAYYNAWIDYDNPIDDVYKNLKKAEKALFEITDELERRGERPLGW